MTDESLREPSLAREAGTQFNPLRMAPTGPVASVAELLGDRYTSEYQDAFPDVLPPYVPFGFLALLQLRRPKTVSRGGIIIPDGEQDAERYRVQATLVRALGPSCFRNRQTGSPWVEGAWFDVGAFVRCPMWGGDRFDVKYGKMDYEKVSFCFVKEADVVGLVTGDPLHVTTS